MGFFVNELGRKVRLHIGTTLLAVVFGYTTREVFSYAGVEGAVGAAKDVDVAVSFLLFHVLCGPSARQRRASGPNIKM